MWDWCRAWFQNMELFTHCTHLWWSLWSLSEAGYHFKNFHTLSLGFLNFLQVLSFKWPLRHLQTSFVFTYIHSVRGGIRQDNCSECLELSWGCMIISGVNQWTSGRVLRVWKSCWVLDLVFSSSPNQQGKFTGNPARIFPCHKGNDEELKALNRWLSSAGAELDLSLYPLQRHAVHTQFHPLPTHRCVIYLCMTEVFISDTFTCQSCGNCPKRLLSSVFFVCFPPFWPLCTLCRCAASSRGSTCARRSVWENRTCKATCESCQSEEH